MRWCALPVRVVTTIECHREALALGVERVFSRRRLVFLNAYAGPAG
jgi:hypothetical protein